MKQRADRDAWGRIALSTILLVILFTPASAEDHFVLWKVYAGKFNPTDTEYVQWDEAKKTRRLAKEKDGDTSHMRRKTIRRPPGQKFTLDTYIWSLDKDEMKDGDFELILHRDETVFIRHVFKVRGCNSS